jgi:hypothetical protein
MSASALIAVFVLSGVLWWFIVTRARRRAPQAAGWLDANRGAHIALLLLFIVVAASFPWWKDGDEPVDAIIAAVGVLGAGAALASRLKTPDA